MEIKPVFSPGCWKETISVGAVDSVGTIQSYSNAQGKIDFYLKDNYTVTTMDGLKKIYTEHHSQQHLCLLGGHQIS